MIIKASGFYRVDFDIKHALQQIVAINPNNLIFGTDLPSTRSNRPYSDDDFLLVIDALGEECASQVFYENAVRFYNPK